MVMAAVSSASPARMARCGAGRTVTMGVGQQLPTMRTRCSPCSGDSLRAVHPAGRSIPAARWSSITCSRRDAGADESRADEPPADESGAVARCQLFGPGASGPNPAGCCARACRARLPRPNRPRPSPPRPSPPRPKFAPESAAAGLPRRRLPRSAARRLPRLLVPQLGEDGVEPSSASRAVLSIRSRARWRLIMLEDAPAGGGLDAHDGRIVTDAVVQVTGEDPSARARPWPGPPRGGHGRSGPAAGAPGARPVPPAVRPRSTHDRAQQSESDHATRRARRWGWAGRYRPRRPAPRPGPGRPRAAHRQTARGDQPQQYLHPGHVLRRWTGRRGPPAPSHASMERAAVTSAPHPGHQAEQPTEQHGPATPTPSTAGEVRSSAPTGIPRPSTSTTWC